MGDLLDAAPFRGLRFVPSRVRDLAAATSPPYDVVDDDGVIRLERAEPHNVVRIVLPRQGAGGPLGRYAHAADVLRAWRHDGTLRRDEAAAYYAYEQQGAGGRQRGVLAAVELTPPGSGAVLPHEEVAPGPVADRTALMDALRAQLEPILLLHEGDAASGRTVAEVLDAADQHPPLVDVVTDDGVRHRVRAVQDEEGQRALRAALRARRALIADGHHRWAAYRALQRRHRAAGAGPGPWDRGLALLVDGEAHPPTLGAIHRSVRGWDPRAVLGRADEQLEVVPASASELAGAARAWTGPQDAPTLAVVSGRSGWLLRAPDAGALDRAVAQALADRDGTPGSAEYRRVDAAVLHALLLPRWGVGEDRVSYHHDVGSAVRAARADAGAAVLLPPAALPVVRALASRGETMPRKSTSFGPKPRSGLVMRVLDDADGTDARGGRD